MALLLLACAPAAHADTCCYAVCGVTTQPPFALSVTCLSKSEECPHFKLRTGELIRFDH